MYRRRHGPRSARPWNGILAHGQPDSVPLHSCPSERRCQPLRFRCRHVRKLHRRCPLPSGSAPNSHADPFGLLSLDLRRQQFVELRVPCCLGSIEQRRLGKRDRWTFSALAVAVRSWTRGGGSVCLGHSVDCPLRARPGEPWRGRFGGSAASRVARLFRRRNGDDGRINIQSDQPEPHPSFGSRRVLRPEFRTSLSPCGTATARPATR